jgi:membrane protease YdiL (CAAX protease family)
VDEPTDPLIGLPAPPAVPPPLPEAPQAPLPPVARTAPRFCRTCGSAWDPAWAVCAVCAPPAGVVPVATDERPAKGRSVHYALSLYFAWLALSFCVIVAALLDANPVTNDMVSSAVAAVMVAAWCVPAAARRAVAEGLRRVQPLWCLLGIAIAPLTFAAATGVLYVCKKAFNIPTIRYTDDLFAAGWGWGMSILLVCVQPAVVEEVAFRGVIFSALREALESGEAVIVRALMFMILHLSVPSFPHLLLIGLALGWLRARTGSLLPGMCLHFTHNLLCIVSERWGG